MTTYAPVSCKTRPLLAPRLALQACLAVIVDEFITALLWFGGTTGQEHGRIVICSKAVICREKLNVFYWGFFS